MATLKAAAPSIPTARVNGVYHPAPSPIRTLVFNPTDPDNEEYRGLKIEARMKIPMSIYFKAAEPVLAGDAEYWEKVRSRHHDFGNAILVSWNAVYPDDQPKAGEPIPCTGEGYMDLDIDMAVAIRNAWFYTLRTPEVTTYSPLAGASTSSATEP